MSKNFSTITHTLFTYGWQVARAGGFAHYTVGAVQWARRGRPYTCRRPLAQSILFSDTCDYPGNITHGRVLLVGHIGKYEYRQYVQLKYEYRTPVTSIGASTSTDSTFSRWVTTTRSSTGVASTIS